MLELKLIHVCKRGHGSITGDNLLNNLLILHHSRNTLHLFPKQQNVYTMSYVYTPYWHQPVVHNVFSLSVIPNKPISSYISVVTASCMCSCWGAIRLHRMSCLLSQGIQSLHDLGPQLPLDQGCHWFTKCRMCPYKPDAWCFSLWIIAVSYIYSKDCLIWPQQVTAVICHWRLQENLIATQGREKVVEKYYNEKIPLLLKFYQKHNKPCSTVAYE